MRSAHPAASPPASEPGAHRGPPPSVAPSLPSPAAPRSELRPVSCPPRFLVRFVGRDEAEVPHPVLVPFGSVGTANARAAELYTANAPVACSSLLQAHYRTNRAGQPLPVGRLLFKV